MPVAQLNNALTQDAYADALTVQFARPRQAFSLHVFNKAILYTLGYVYADQANTADIQFDVAEHQLAPSLSDFANAALEGLPPNTIFAGIKIRSAAAGIPARVTVM